MLEAAARLSPSITVMLTDLDAPFGPRAACPVLWAVPGRGATGRRPLRPGAAGSGRSDAQARVRRLRLPAAPSRQSGAIQGARLSRGRGSRPRMWSAAFSPTMIEGAFSVAVRDLREDRLSASRSPSTPITRACGSTTAIGIVRAPHPAGAAGVIGAFGMFADRVVERRRLCVHARQDLVAGETSIGVCAMISRVRRIARRKSTQSFVAHVVEQDRGRRGGSGPRSATRPRLSDRIGPTWAWNPCPCAATVDPS
jgi:hypothetical protein